MPIFIRGNGDDEILGTALADIILSGKGDDTVFGGAGDDLIATDKGDDIVDAGEGNDLIFAGKGDDIVDGGEGDDLILAGKGDDLITGGIGSDYIDGEKGEDTAIYAGDIRDFGFSFFGSLLTITDLANGDEDTLLNVENLKFNNADIVLDGGNNAVIADDVATTTDEDTPIGGNLLAEAGAFDFEGDTITVVDVDGNPGAVGMPIVLASGALLTVNADGTYSYDPNDQFEDLDTGETAVETVSFDLSDGTSTITRTLEITIDGVTDNVAPVARDVLYEVDENDLSLFETFAFDADDADPDDDPGTLTYVTPGMPDAPIGIILPNPTADFANNQDGTFLMVLGNDVQAVSLGDTRDYTHTYSVIDSHGVESNEATVTIRVIGENDAPTRPFFRLFYQQEEDSGLMVASYDVIDPDSDDNAATLTYDIEVPVGLSIFDNGDGTYSVDTGVGFDHLAEGETQSFSFDFTATDQHGATTAFTNSFGIFGVNDDPQAFDDEFETDEETPISGDLFADNGFGADSDVDNGDTFQVTAINGLAVIDGEVVALDSGALLTINADGTFDYDPNGHSGADSFGYEIADGKGGFDTATAEFNIQEIDDGLLIA